MKTSLKLKNNTFGSSLNGIIYSIIFLIVAGGIPAAFIFSNPHVLRDILENPGAAICTIILIACIVLAFLLSVIQFIKGNNEHAKNAFNVKTMEFSKNGVFMTFNDVSLNCFYNYNRLKHMEIKLHTINVHNFNTSTYRSELKFFDNALVPAALNMKKGSNNGKVFVSEIEVEITDDLGQKNSIVVSKIALFDTNMYKLLQDLKFYRQFFSNFSYTFKGPKDKKAENILGS